MKAILLEGRANETISYDICSPDRDVRYGKKEFCINAIGVHFASKCDSIVTISSNVHETNTVEKNSGQIKVQQSVLALINLEGEKDTKKVQHFSDCKWFAIEKLIGNEIKFDLTDAIDDKPLRDPHHVYLHVLYRPI